MAVKMEISKLSLGLTTLSMDIKCVFYFKIKN